MSDCTWSGRTTVTQCFHSVRLTSSGVSQVWEVMSIDATFPPGTSVTATVFDIGLTPSYGPAVPCTGRPR